MNLNERANYMLALLVSVAFHFAILLLFMAGQFFTKPANLQTLPVGMVEIAAGSPDGTTGMIGMPGEENIAAPPVSNPAETPDKDKVAVKPKIGPKSIPEDAILVPKKDTNGIAGEHGQKPIPGVSPVNGVPGANGPGGTGVGKPLGFGSGEGMVTVLGPPINYPKNAMNEGKEGNVVVRILVKTDGSLEDIIPRKSSGDSRLDNAVISGIKRNWKFKPVSNSYYVDVEFSFKIDSPFALQHFIMAESRP